MMNQKPTNLKFQNNKKCNSNDNFFLLTPTHCATKISTQVLFSINTTSLQIKNTTAVRVH